MLLGRRSITTTIAAPIEAATGYPTDMLMRLQIAHGLAEVRREGAERLAAIPRLAA